MAEDRRTVPQCELDGNGCLQLSCMLRSFNAPISEEQAWAVCYQTARCMAAEWTAGRGPCYCLADTSHIRIMKDGSVHPATVTSPSSGTTRAMATSEYKLVTSLGLAIFYALDYGLCEDEERKLSPPLEILIDRMTSAEAQDGEDDDNSSEGYDVESQNGDEGIERDSGEDDMNDNNAEDGKRSNGLTLLRVMEMCAAHLPSPSQADVHYKAVCRALVAEALELSMFLERISTGTKELLLSGSEEVATLEKLECQDWARLWIQVVQQLRQGVKLKKVDRGSHSHSLEYELTPYEMLLDDIRSRRYKLNKVMVNGDIPPRVKKDAHALILEFIRSRPPLIPVSKRKLPPTPPRQLSLYEKLMASIKQQHTLKPTATRELSVETSRTKLEDTDKTPQPLRRLIKADLSFRMSSSFEDDEMEDLPLSPQEEPPSLPTGKEKPQSRALSETATTERRHSITVCESPPKPECNGTASRGKPAAANSPADNTPASGHSNTDYWLSSQWKSLECLSLTLEEVVHIRNVLTKADLESLVVSPSLYEDIVKGKICFACKRTRFSFFGAWGVKCKLCERMVCDKCSTKMHIPTENFSNVPVYMLSPTASPPPEEESSSHRFWKISEAFHFSSSSSTTRDSAPEAKAGLSTGKRPKFKHSESVDVLATPRGKPSHSLTMKRAPLLRSKTVHHEPERGPQAEDRPRGPLVTVCRDCKDMLCHIILASRNQGTPRERRKAMKGWSKQRAVSCASTAACMSPVSETSQSPEEKSVG